MLYDTIASIATPLTPSGIGIIRVSGDESIKIVNSLFKSNIEGKKISNVKSHTINYGYIINPNDDSIVDEVLVSIMKAPNSYTKEDIVEINCHGGVVVMQKVLKLVLENGARLAEPGEFTKRAFLNGRIDLSQAEAVIDIINAKTDMLIKSSINQLSGSVSEKLSTIKNQLLELIAHIEASIDYPEYDIDEINEDNVIYRINNIIDLIKTLIDSYDNGRIIKEGIKTAIIGKPNVGKSSLLNALLREQRAIVTDIPGTTRDILEEYMNVHGVPIRLIDTAGIRDTNDLVEKIGVDKAKKMVEEAELIILMIDSSNELSKEDLNVLELVKNKKAIILLNKIDIKQKVTRQDLKEYARESHIIPISVINLKGIDKLEESIKEMFFIGKIDFNDNVYITNVRHKNALDNALNHLNEVKKSIENGFPEDFWAIDLKNVYENIGEVTGDSVNEDLIQQIFSQFCLGK